MLESASSAFDRFLEARWKLLQDANPPHHGEYGWRALLSPEFHTRLRAEDRLDDRGGGPRDQKIPARVAGLPFTVSRNLSPNHLAILFCGRDPFDPQHPERTVVITKQEAQQPTGGR